MLRCMTTKCLDSLWRQRRCASELLHVPTYQATAPSVRHQGAPSSARWSSLIGWMPNTLARYYRLPCKRTLAQVLPNTFAPTIIMKVLDKFAIAFAHSHQLAGPFSLSRAFKPAHKPSLFHTHSHAYCHSHTLALSHLP